MEEIKKAKLKDLIQDDRNLNKGTERGQQLIEKSLREFGAGRSLLLDKNNRIIAGNKTHRNAEAIGMDDVIIVETDGTKLVAVKRTDIDLDSQKGRKMAMADNVTTQVDLSWDTDELDAVAEDYDIDLEEWDMELDGEVPDLNNAQEDDFDEEKDEINTVAQRGDVFLLGDHRLMCGDSTSDADVETLMNGENADISFFSPPYNAGFGANLTKPNGRNSKYINYDDNKTQEDYANFLQSSINNGMRYSKYTFCNIQMLANNKSAFANIVYKNIEKLGDIIIWDKGHAQPQLAERVLNSVFEFILVFHDKGTRAIGTKQFHGNIDNIIHISPTRNKYSKEHNAVFPIELPSHFIYNFSNKSVLDLFGGSGTTMIAAEQLGRKCYMMELDPHYCDVIIARWEKLTGKKAVKINNAK